MNDGKAGIIDSFRDGDSLRVAIDRQQASLRSQLGENQARVAAAAKGTINVDTVGRIFRPLTASSRSTVVCL